jgi:2-dehydro-3-deoxyphosphooctonate aldolase (KDO 8-P synthase)
MGGGGPLLLIAGPCVIESESHAVGLAIAIRDIARRAGVPFIFKVSYDKANRTSGRSFRGPGLVEGVRVLARVREAAGVPILTDIHEPGQAAPVAEVADVLQIPAFLSRQTVLLVAAGAAGKPVNIKKGQWMHPEAMRGAAAKVRQGFTDAGRAGAAEVAATERGTFFGYGDLVVDFRALPRMRAACDAPVVFDATHSVQQPGRGEGGASGGAREFVGPLSLAACAVGTDGLFLETHPDPDHAPSDGPNMVPLDALNDLVLRAVDVWHRARA